MLCLVCGKEFNPGQSSNGHKSYCSDECYHASRKELCRLRQREHRARKYAMREKHATVDISGGGWLTLRLSRKVVLSKDQISQLEFIINNRIARYLRTVENIGKAATTE